MAWSNVARIVNMKSCVSRDWTIFSDKQKYGFLLVSII